jgi:hypothetical protein
MLRMYEIDGCLDFVLGPTVSLGVRADCFIDDIQGQLVRPTAVLEQNNL